MCIRDSILTGPTAVGKTDLSIQLAKKINGEIISADSSQVYKGMDIGSAKITKEETDGIPHHLIDILEPCLLYTSETDINISNMSLKDRKIIINGIYVESSEELFKFLEENTS